MDDRGIIFSLRREGNTDPGLEYFPLFTVIVPGHNEEQVIEETVLNLKDLNYPNYEVIVVNDGQLGCHAGDPRRLLTENASWLRIIHLEPNSGKSKALNAAILVSRGEFMLTIDADCLVDKDVLQWMAVHLVNFPRVGAVTGNPRVRNRTSLLAKIQVGEYSNIIGLIKRTQRILGKVLTASGVIAAYRRSASSRAASTATPSPRTSTSPGSCSASSRTSATSLGPCAGSSSPRRSRAFAPAGGAGPGRRRGARGISTSGRTTVTAAWSGFTSIRSGISLGHLSWPWCFVWLSSSS